MNSGGNHGIVSNPGKLTNSPWKCLLDGDLTAPSLAAGSVAGGNTAGSLRPLMAARVTLSLEHRCMISTGSFHFFRSSGIRSQLEQSHHLTALSDYPEPLLSRILGQRQLQYRQYYFLVEAKPVFGPLASVSTGIPVMPVARSLHTKNTTSSSAVAPEECTTPAGK